jgi:hypothetical protein
LAVHFCARVAGYTVRQYTTDAEALAESVLCYYERFKPDASINIRFEVECGV